MVAHKLLADLNDRDGPHTLLKLRLLNAWGSYSIKNPEHIFSYCTLWNDEEGTLVQGSAVPTLISHFREILRLGSVYFVSGVMVQPPGSTYRCCSHKLSIVLSQETVFKEVAESDPPFWQDAFEFVPFSSLQSRIGSSVYLTDIVGSVVSVGGISHSVNNFGDTVRRDVVLQNESHMKVTVALWGPQTLCVDYERIMELSTAGAVLLGFCSLKVSGTHQVTWHYIAHLLLGVFMSRSEMTELIRSVCFAERNSVVYIPPRFSTCEEATSFEEQCTKTLEELISLCDPNYVNLTRYHCSARIVIVDSSRQWHYVGCDFCSKATKPYGDTDSWCEKHRRLQPCQTKQCYKIHITVRDDTGSATFVLLGKVAEDLVGVDAASLLARFQFQRGQLPPDLLALEGREVNFDVQLPKPQYLGRGPPEFCVLATPEKRVSLKQSSAPVVSVICYAKPRLSPGISVCQAPSVYRKGKGVKQYVSFSAGETSSAPSKQDRSLSASLSKSISHVSDISDEDDQIHLRRTNVQNRLSSSVIDESLLPVEPVYLPEEHVIRRRRRLVLAGHAIGQSFLAEPDICCAFSDDVSASLSDDTFVPPTEHDATLVSEILLEVSKSKSEYCDPKLKHGNDVSVIDVEKDTALLSEIVVPTSVASKSKKRRSCSKNPKDDVLQSHPAMPSEDVCPALKAKHRHSRTKGASRTGKFSSYKKLLNLTAPVKEPFVDENIQTKIASEDVTLLFEVVAPTSAYLKSKKRGSRSKNVQANPVMASEGVCPVLKTKHQRSQTKNSSRSGKLSSQDKLLSLATPIKEPSVAKSVQTEIASEDAVFMEGDDALEGQPAMVSKVVALTSEPKVRRIRSKNTTRNEKSGWSAKAIHVEKNTVLDDIAHVQGEGITVSEKNLAVDRSKRNRTPSRKALEAVASQSMPSMGRASSQKRKQPIK